MITSPYFALLAEFGTADIELDRVCQKYFGLDPAEAKRRASMNRLPVPAFRAGSQKAPWLISAAELAAHLERLQIDARKEWQRSQTTGPAEFDGLRQ